MIFVLRPMPLSMPAEGYLSWVSQTNDHNNPGLQPLQRPCCNPVLHSRPWHAGASVMGAGVGWDCSAAVQAPFST